MLRNILEKSAQAKQGDEIPIIYSHLLKKYTTFYSVSQTVCYADL
jgi:hypothetical protein